MQLLIHLVNYIVTYNYLSTPVLTCAYLYLPVIDYQVRLEVNQEALNAIAQLAMERKTGARGLRAIMVGISLQTI